jgi:hypothetical protein
VDRPRAIPCGAALALATATGCAPTCGPGAPPGAPDAGADTIVGIIDAHIHTELTGGEERTSHIPLTREELLREMRDAGVVGAVAHTGRRGENYVDMRAEGVVHCAGVDAEVDVPRLEAGLEAGRFRCLKIYLGYVHQYASDPRYAPAYELAKRYGVPVVFHTGDTYAKTAKLKYADPLTVDEVAVDHPEVTFVLAHLGNPWLESAAEVAFKNPNVYLEGSALLIGDVSKMSPEQVELYLIRPVSWVFGYLEDASKLMFGSDWPLNRIGPYAAAFRKAIPPAHQRAVFHDNAARIFKLGP